MNYSLVGVINTKTNTWEDDFLTWLESRNEGYGGSIVELTEEDLYDEPTKEELDYVNKILNELDNKGSIDDRI
jgi:hypothetical protein